MCAAGVFPCWGLVLEVLPGYQYQPVVLEWHGTDVDSWKSTPGVLYGMCVGIERYVYKGVCDCLVRTYV